MTDTIEGCIAECARKGWYWNISGYDPQGESGPSFRSVSLMRYIPGTSEAVKVSSAFQNTKYTLAVFHEALAQAYEVTS
jgi:hypothetical protein